MTDLAGLRQRVKSVGAHFRGAAEEDRKRSERLSSLLSAVEGGFARSQHEIKRLSEELARANEEKQQNSETRETSTVIPVLTDEAAEESEPAGAEDGEEKEPLDLTQMVTEEIAGVKSNAGWRRPAADKDRMEIQQDIELISRALREGHDGRHQKQHWRRFLGGAN